MVPAAGLSLPDTEAAESQNGQSHFKYNFSEHRISSKLSPEPSLLIHDCTATYIINYTIKFSDDMIVGGWEYRKEMEKRVLWCGAHNLHLNVDKTKEMVINLRRDVMSRHLPLTTGDTTVERIQFNQVPGSSPGR